MSRSAHPAGPRHADVLPEGHYAAPPADLNALDPRVWARTVTRDADGVVSVGGLDVRALAEEFGTPAYVLDEADFRGPLPCLARRLRAGRRRLLRGQGVPVARRRALAARGGPQPRRLLRRRAGRRAVARACPAERIALHGNNKSGAEIRQAVEAGVGRIVRRLLPGDRPASRTSPKARPAAAGADPRHRRRRGAHPRVHRHRARGPEVRFLAGRRGRGRGGTPGAAAGLARAGRHPLAHRLADLRHLRLRGRGAPGGRPARGRSATSTASSCRRSTSAAASASPTPPTTTRASRTRSPRRCARSSPASAGRRSSPCRGCRSSRAARSSGPTAFTLYEVGTVKPLEGLRDVRQRRRRHVATTSAPRCTTPSTACALVSRARATPSRCSSRVVGKHCESRRHRRAGRLPARRPRARRPARGAGDRRVLPLDGQQLQPRPAPAGGRRHGRRGPGDRPPRDGGGSPASRRRADGESRSKTSGLAIRTVRGNSRPVRETDRREGRRSRQAKRGRMMRTRPLKVALLGCGVVGSEVARIMTTHADDLAARIGAPVELAGVAVRRPDRARAGVPARAAHHRRRRRWSTAATSTWSSRSSAASSRPAR